MYFEGIFVSFICIFYPKRIIKFTTKNVWDLKFKRFEMNNYLED